MKPTLNSITANLMVDDVDATVAYYEEILGFSLDLSVPRDDGKLQWALVMRDEVELMLHEKENLLSEVPQLKGSVIGGSLTLFVRMKNLDTYYHEIKGRAEVIKEPMTTFYGMNEFTIQDINGYILTFAEPEEESNH